ncbi:MAG: hypothetical protein JO036_20320 [Candidatus Eremiobacteraeota bacterium]|nr:hypothetical protein [Candidatus Eremiobacteraeota bacterium]
MADTYVRPLFVIGDSHSGPLNALVLRDETTGEPLAVSEAYCVQGLSAKSSLSPEGEFHPGIVAALAAFHMLRLLPHGYTGELLTVRLGDSFFTPSWIADHTYVLFTVGEIDAREIIASIPLDADPLLSFDADLSLLPPAEAPRILPAADLDERIVEQMGQLFRMLVGLRDFGIPRLAVSSLPPPTRDDDEYARLTGVTSRARTRYAVHLAINATLRRFCEEANMRFIDTWNEMTERNVAKAGLLLDGVHVGHAGARPILRQYHSIAMEAALP